MRLIAAALLLSVSVTPVAAIADEAKPAKPAKAPKICRKIGTATTGSRLGQRKMCKTEAEWATYEQRAEHDMDNMGTDSRTAPH